MIYPIDSQLIPHDRRAEINEKILADIDSGNEKIPKESIYNSFTGIGGLHNLKLDDYPNYHEYAKAKKATELGQFFTPHELCEQMVDVASPQPTDMVLDMCCGMGNFFNHLPNLYNAFGFDIDENAVKVARHLYPEADIETMDIKHYNPEQRFDIIIGNPPFNLDFGGIQSQYYYCNKAYDLLNPSGLLLIIVPCSFLMSDFWDKKHVNAINDKYSFLGQVKLDPNAFSSLGVKNFETKVIAFLRESYNIEMQPYSAETFISFEELKEKVIDSNEVKKEQKLKLLQETTELNQAEERAFEYKVTKYLYELKTHPHLKHHYKKAMALVTKCRNQKPPTDCSDEERKKWEAHKLTHKRVLGILKKYIKNQYVVPRNEVALVRTKYEFKLKAYAPRLLDKVPIKSVKLYDLIANEASLPQPPEMTVSLEAQFKQANKIIDKLRRQYQKASTPFEEMERDKELDKYIRSLRTISPKTGKKFVFTKLQRHDIGLLFQKRYSLMNWQQGSGKTAVAYHFARYLMKLNRVKGTIILAPAIAIKMTWEPFMIANNEDYLVLEDIDDLRYLTNDQYILLSTSMLDKFERYIKILLKLWSQKICLIFDESDEITNPTALRTKLTLSCFRRVRYKMLATGTTTRNYIGELYPQFELMYNNSVNMMCYCYYRYYQNKEGEIDYENNEYYGEPFPVNGSYLFRSCFSPFKTTVFGIEKNNQDIYNKDSLAVLIGKTIITRKFKEFAGDKFSIHTHVVKPSEAEIEVQKSVIRDFNELCKLYFSDIKDERKKAGLRMRRQIELMIKSCSVPQNFPSYCGDDYPEKAKKIGRMIKKTPDKVAVGVTSKEALNIYCNYLEFLFPKRKVFRIDGSIDFERRQDILDMFEATENGILVATQQSLKSSVNIPSCNTVLLESMQWNVPKMEQFYFRFIRLDSKEHTNVHYITYADSIEQNILALVLTKERINEFIKTGEVLDESEIYEEFGVTMDEINSNLRRHYDEEGKVYFTWGSMLIAA